MLLDDGKEYKVESKSERRGVVERVTKETFIECDVRLDGDGTSQVRLGVESEQRAKSKEHVEKEGRICGLFVCAPSF